MTAGLTPAGVLHSWVLGASICSAFGTGGYALVCLYFLLGTAVREQQSAMLRCCRPGAELPAGR